MMDEIAKVVEEKATEIFEITVRDYTSEHPLAIIDEESRTVAKERVTSQLMFSLSNLRFPENTDWKERFDGWDDGLRKESFG